MCIAAALTGLVHEVGHFIPSYLFGWEPFISFARGGSVKFQSQPVVVSPWQDLISLLGGPGITFVLAGIFTWCSQRRTLPAIAAAIRSR